MFLIAFGNCVLEEKFMRCLMILFCQQIDNDLSISRNVSSNKMIHAILALVFLTKLFLPSRFSAPKHSSLFCYQDFGVFVFKKNTQKCSRQGQCPVVFFCFFLSVHFITFEKKAWLILQGFLALLMVIPNDFDTLLDYFSFSMWIFHGSTCAALLYFRYKLPNYPRPIKVK